MLGSVLETESPDAGGDRLGAPAQHAVCLGAVKGTPASKLRPAAPCSAQTGSMVAAPRRLAEAAEVALQPRALAAASQPEFSRSGDDPVMMAGRTGCLELAC